MQQPGIELSPVWLHLLKESWSRNLYRLNLCRCGNFFNVHFQPPPEEEEELAPELMRYLNRNYWEQQQRENQQQQQPPQQQQQQQQQQQMQKSDVKAKVCLVAELIPGDYLLIGDEQFFL